MEPVAAPAAVAFNDSDLTALTTLPTAALVVAASALLAAVAMSWLSTRGAPLRLRLGLFALRVLLVIGVFVVLLEPGRRLLATSREPDRVVVAVDTSASMAVGEGDQQRIKLAARAALAVVDDVRSREPPLVPEVWFFDDTFTARSVDDLKALRDGVVVPTGGKSRLALPIERAEQQQAAPATSSSSSTTANALLPLGGLVIVSDGADTTGLPATLTTDLRERLKALGAPQPVPVHTVVVGADDNFKDVVLERAIADEFAFVRNPMTVDVVIRQRGYTGTSLPLTLAEDGVVVGRTEVLLADKGSGVDGELRASFVFTPQRAGKRLYTVQAPVLDGEAIAENNRLDFTVKLIRDRIRVLQVAGRPSWDERFVRRLLKENPSVDLISFFILRSTTDISGANNNELSLIPFPTKELFTEQLSTFDVVIFQDFNYRPYNMGIYLQNVADYVKGGGGFLMMGGDLSFSEGDYAETPLADVLPVTLRPGHGHLDTEDFTPVLTEVGRRHPITDVAGTVDSATTNPFSQLPQLQGLNLVAGLKDGAVALLTHPFQNGDDGKPQPVIAVKDVEKGRSVAVMTDTSWHWSLPQVGLGSGRGDAHRKLLANTLRWLIRDPELSRVKLTIDADARGIEPGAAVSALVRAQDALYQPEAGASVKLSLLPLDADARGDGRAPVANSDPLVTGADGSARTLLHPDRPGAWKVRVEVEKDGQLVGVDEDVFVVRTASLERLHAEARPDLLASIASASGGRAVDVNSVEGLPFVDHGRVRVHRQKTEPLWNSGWVLGALVLLAGLEWWWRRRRGFA